MSNVNRSDEGIQSLAKKTQDAGQHRAHTRSSKRWKATKLNNTPRWYSTSGPPLRRTKRNIRATLWREYGSYLRTAGAQRGEKWQPSDKKPPKTANWNSTVTRARFHSLKRKCRRHCVETLWKPKWESAAVPWIVKMKVARWFWSKVRTAPWSETKSTLPFS